jgi:hypothetical protein
MAASPQVLLCDHGSTVTNGVTSFPIAATAAVIDVLSSLRNSELTVGWMPSLSATAATCPLLAEGTSKPKKTCRELVCP